MTQELFHYRLEFRPTGSFVFSGNTSLRTGKKISRFLDDAIDRRSRESFIIKTDVMPPQTTVVGAIRNLIRQDARPGEDITELIGRNSFDPAAAEKAELGCIKRVSAVGVCGVMDDTPVICYPGPLDQKGELSEYSPILPAEYDPKKGYSEGFLAFDEAAGGNLGWRKQEGLFKKDIQPAFQIPENGAPERNEGNFHLQERCRFLDASNDLHKGAFLQEPAFFAYVSLTRDIQDRGPAVISLGGRESQFLTYWRPVDRLPALALQNPPTPVDYRLALLSPARLPDGWHDGYGIAQAFVNQREIRCARSIYEEGRMVFKRMALNREVLHFADAGSVFIFGDEGKRDAFRDALEGAAIRVGGYNQTISYQR